MFPVRAKASLRTHKQKFHRRFIIIKIRLNDTDLVTFESRIEDALFFVDPLLVKME